MRWHVRTDAVGFSQQACPRSPDPLPTRKTKGTVRGKRKTLKNVHSVTRCMQAANKPTKPEHRPPKSTDSDGQAPSPPVHSRCSCHNRFRFFPEGYHHFPATRETWSLWNGHTNTQHASHSIPRRSSTNSSASASSHLTTSFSDLRSEEMVGQSNLSQASG